MFNGKAIDYQDIPLRNDRFWPDINVGDFQRARRIPADVDAQTVADALLSAVTEINEELSAVQKKAKTAGFHQAITVPGVSMETGNFLTIQYKKAIYARAKADLMGEFATLGRRDAHPGQESEETRKGLLAEAAMVIRQMKGLKRATVRKV